MIRHLIKLSWNKKKAHALLIVEVWASFMVLFGLATLIIYNVRNYSEPLGFSYENVWAINLSNNQDTTEIAQKAKMISQRLKAYPEVESVSRMSDNFPFSSSYNGRVVGHGKTTMQVGFYVTDEQFARTLTIPLAAGRWYRNTDSVGKSKPVILNQKAVESLFGDENPLGKALGSEGSAWQVAGVINAFKGKGEFTEEGPVMVELLNENDPWNKTMLIRVKPGTDAVFEAKVVRDITSMVKGWSMEVSYLSEARKNLHNQTLVPIIIFLIICSFLLINVALGLFGVLNVSIARRRGEIGLRRALGATEGAISEQFVVEIWVLATFALVLGLLLAGQFPLLNVFDLDSDVYLLAMLVSVIIIYLLVTLCALYPSRQAATIQPAVALHEE